VFYVIGFGKFSRLFFKLLATCIEVLYECALHQFTVNLAALLSLWRFSVLARYISEFY